MPAVRQVRPARLDSYTATPPPCINSRCPQGCFSGPARMAPLFRSLPRLPLALAPRLAWSNRSLPPTTMPQASDPSKPRLLSQELAGGEACSRTSPAPTGDLKSSPSSHPSIGDCSSRASEGRPALQQHCNVRACCSGRREEGAPARQTSLPKAASSQSIKTCTRRPRTDLATSRRRGVSDLGDVCCDPVGAGGGRPAASTL